MRSGRARAERSAQRARQNQTRAGRRALASSRGGVCPSRAEATRARAEREAKRAQCLSQRRAEHVRSNGRIRARSGHRPRAIGRSRCLHRSGGSASARRAAVWAFQCVDSTGAAGRLLGWRDRSQARAALERWFETRKAGGATVCARQRLAARVSTPTARGAAAGRPGTRCSAARARWRRALVLLQGPARPLASF